MRTLRIPFAVALGAALTLLAGCLQQTAIVELDGSSTVYPISEAVAEEFRRDHSTPVTIGVSGTSGGFQKLIHGDVQLIGASRPVKSTEKEALAKTGRAFVELPVAYDGISIVVNPANDWVDHFTVAELKKLWEPAAQGVPTRWSHLREGWPDRPIQLFGPGVDSGTYDYFTKAIVGKEHSSRGDFTSSEDDNVLVQGVATDRDALGFFGYAYYRENRSRLRVVPVDDGKASNGEGPVAPSLETVANGTYQPLSRPVFLYVDAAAVKRPDVAGFLDFYLKEVPRLSQEVGYIPLQPRTYELVRARLAAGTTGSLFGAGGSKVGVTVAQLLGGEVQ